MLRLWIYDGTNYRLWSETAVLANTPSSSVQVWSAAVSSAATSQSMPLVLPATSSLRATVNDTQLALEAAPASIAPGQTTSGTALVNLTGASMTLAAAASIAVAAAPSISVPMTLTTTPFVVTVPALISITSAANLSSVGYRIIGRSLAGAVQSELLSGPNAGTVYSANAYKSVSSIIPNGSNAGTASIGTSAAAGPVVFPQPSQITLISGGNLSAINFTITGLSTVGAVQSEVLAGPNVGVVTSVNTYQSVFTVAPSAAVTTNVQVGTAPILTSIAVIARGGDF
jgi:hypothetical protein